jgi:gliding motility-associated-like protein
MPVKAFGILLIGLALTGILRAQDCQNAEQLCAEIAAETDSITIPNAVDFGCMDVQSSYFFSFTTNNEDPGVVGNATISITNINCSGQALMDTLYAMVVLPPGLGLGDPCDPTNWTQIGSCESDTLTIGIETPELLPSTTYYLIVGSNQPTNQLDCLFDVSISGPAVDINACCDTQVSLGQSAEITVSGGDPGFTGDPDYTWQPPSWLDDFTSDVVVSYPEESITYVVSGNIDGCTVTDVITIIVGPPIGIYNTFTPNGDGINDDWQIAGIAQFDNAQVNIYDRWGQLVFKSVGYAQPWDGTRGGKFLPTGVYYYVIELNSLDVNIEPVTGFVTLVH